MEESEGKTDSAAYAESVILPERAVFSVRGELPGTGETARTRAAASAEETVISLRRMEDTDRYMNTS